MVRTLMKLLDGDSSILEHYRLVREILSEAVDPGDESEELDLETLTERLGLAQSTIEMALSSSPDRNYKKEVMGTVAVAQFYDDGFHEHLHEVEMTYRALWRSMVSVEVKSYAKRVAEVLGLFDEIPELEAIP